MCAGGRSRSRTLGALTAVRGRRGYWPPPRQVSALSEPIAAPQPLRLSLQAPPQLPKREVARSGSSPPGRAGAQGGMLSSVSKRDRDLTRCGHPRPTLTPLPDRPPPTTLPARGRAPPPAVRGPKACLRRVPHRVVDTSGVDPPPCALSGGRGGAVSRSPSPAVGRRPGLPPAPPRRRPPPGGVGCGDPLRGEIRRVREGGEHGPPRRGGGEGTAAGVPRETV